MKKLLTIVLAMVIAMGITACTSSKDELVMGIDDSFPPMGFRNDKGELVGFDLDLAKEASKRMGKEIKFQPIDWSSKELELSSKKIDIIWNGLTITPERQEKMLFTKPYLVNKQIIVVDKSKGINTKADLYGKEIGVQKESTAVDAVKKDTETASKIGNMVEYGQNILAFQDLKIGRISAVVVDEVVAKYYLANTETNFTILEEDFGGEEYGVGVRLGDTELANAIQSALDDMEKDGTTANIKKEWFGE